MGDNASTLRLCVDNEFSSKKEICEEADKYSYLLGKQNRNYCNQDNLLYIVCAKQCCVKIDAENQLSKKDHVDGGGSRKEFVRKSYPVERTVYIKATKIKKYSDYQVDNSLQYVIQESSDHTCTTSLSPLCGSISVPYSIPKISQLIHHIMKNKLSMSIFQIGNLFKPRNSLSDENILIMVTCIVFKKLQMY